MKRLTYYIILLAFIACSKPSAIKKQLSGTDSLVVQFNKPGTDSIQSILNATDRNAINELIGFIDSQKSPLFKCGYDGNLLFYKKGTLAGDVSFNFSGDSCKHFIMVLNGELTPTRMSNKAADFLKSLSNRE